MDSDIVIRAEKVSKQYRLGVINHGTLYRDLQSWWAKFRGNADPNSTIGEAWSHSSSRVDGDLFRALEDVSFEVARGELLGVIGGNGAGKSTLLKVLSRITAPTTGWVGLTGRVASLLEVGTGFHPELTGRENVFLNGTILGMSQREISRKFDEIVDFAEISQFIDTPVKRYSSGMYVRLAFSVAAHLESEILLVDEVLAVGDVSFQRKCLGKMKDIRVNGRTILFVSHNMAAIEQLCTKVLVLNDGTIKYFGQVREGMDYYLNTIKSLNKNLFVVENRKGNGKAQVKAISLESSRGAELQALKCGENVSINVSIIMNVARCLNVSLAIGITSISGDGLIHLSTETSGLDINETTSDFILKCSVPQLPLRAGTYSLNLYLASNGIVSDWLVDCFRFDVENADFYGTGRLPGEGYSPFLVRQIWELSTV